MQPKSIILFFYGYILFFRRQYFIKREDLEIVKIEKMKFLNQVEVCFVIKTKNKILLKCFESIYKKEDLEKLKNWYKNKL